MASDDGLSNIRTTARIPTVCGREVDYGSNPNNFGMHEIAIHETIHEFAKHDFPIQETIHEMAQHDFPIQEITHEIAKHDFQIQGAFSTAYVNIQRFMK